MTGDPSWIRGELRPKTATATDVHGGMTEDELAEARRLAVPAVLAYRDGGCVPHALREDVAREMMSFIGCRPVDGPMVPMFLEDLQLDGTDSGAITWADEIPDNVKAGSHVVVVGCGESGLLAGIRLAQAGLPFTIVDKNDGPGGTWRENRYPGARVDVGSHHYCYSFEPSDHWSEYFCQQPELRSYFVRVLDKYDLGRTVALLPTSWLRLGTTVPVAGTSGSATATAVWRSSTPGSWSAPSDRSTCRGSQTSPAAALPRPVVPLSPVARRSRHRPGHGSRWSVPAPAASRSRRRSRIGSASSRSSSALRSGCSPTPSTTRRCHPVNSGRCGTSRSTAGGFGS